MRKLLRLLLGILVVMAVSLTAAPAAEAAARPYCGIWWGSLAKTGAGPSYASATDYVYNVRTGRHACYDRLVIDVSGPVGTYNVQYVSQIHTEGGGFPVATRGGAALQISVMNPGYNPVTGAQTFFYANPNELRNVTGYRTFRQVVWAGTYEGYSSVGIGVRARLPFRVFVLTGPGSSSRLVVDVAHRW
ncbi:MAG TPA: hypothetical protein VFK68_00510 [Propionibacteriaceae bacterium]|nr:hypothetical protein [Propionibacteriaceae bacterium]